MIFAAIDPGLTGAVCILHPDGRAEFYDTPVVQLGKKRDYDLRGMVDILERLDDLDVCTQRPLVGLERVHSMPGQGVASTFSFGGGYRAWEMALVCLKLPYQLVTPQRWKGALMDGQGRKPDGKPDKDASRVVAMRLFPQLAGDLKLKKYHGRADALLIAEYLRRTTGAKGGA